MMGQITGRATIRIDGREFPTERGATLDPGGVNREAVMGGINVFWREEPMPPKLSATVLHTEDIDPIWLNTLRDATVLFECDNGQDYVLHQAFTTNTQEMNSGQGQIRLEMSARRCERL